MNKEQLLQELSNKIKFGEMSYDEVKNRLSPMVTHDTPSADRFSVTKMLYILGAVVVVLGIVLFTYQIWNDIGSFGRILITLGLGLLITTIGTFLMKDASKQAIGTVFYFIGGMLIPGGSLVTLSELGIGQSPYWPMAITFGCIFIFYVVLNLVYKNVILTFFAIGNGTAFAYLVLRALTIDVSYYYANDLYAYLTMVLGLCYLFLAQYFKNGWNSRLVEVLNFFGSAGLLGAAFSEIFDSTGWRFFFVILVIGGFMLSIHVKSRGVLVVSTISLIAYVSYITGKYFAGSVGWPISLVVLGFIFIALGYVSIAINKKYIKNN